MAITRLVIASQNQGKVVETQAVLAGLGVEVSCLADFADAAKNVVAETASTFAGNALLKAQAYARLLHSPVLADDSGLEVMALGGEPGVASNRWLAGTDADRNAGLLSRLATQSDRRARFVTVLCYLDPSQDQPQYFEGEVFGTITTQPMGEHGFGYDPIFLPAGQNSTYAQMGLEQKNQLSHRARALAAFRKYCQSLV